MTPLILQLKGQNSILSELPILLLPLSVHLLFRMKTLRTSLIMPSCTYSHQEWARRSNDYEFASMIVAIIYLYIIYISNYFAGINADTIIITENISKVATLQDTRQKGGRKSLLHIRENNFYCLRLYDTA